MAARVAWQRAAQMFETCGTCSMSTSVIVVIVNMSNGRFGHAYIGAQVVVVAVVVIIIRNSKGSSIDRSSHRKSNGESGRSNSSSRNTPTIQAVAITVAMETLQTTSSHHN